MKAKAYATIAATIAVVALLALPGPATARRPDRPRHPNLLERLVVKGSNGFDIEVDLSNRQRLTLSAAASRGPGLVFAGYTLKAPQAPGSPDIEASLGKLGRIDVRFVPESVKYEEPTVPVCKGEKTKVEAGHFVGLIAFHGERDYTRVHITRALGSVITEPAPSCRKRSRRHQAEHGPQTRGRAETLMRRAVATAAGSKSKVHLAELKATLRGSRVAFEAARVSFPPVKGHGGNLLNFSAAATRDRGRIKEAGGALDLLISGPYFKVPDITHPTSEALIEPPAPFLGAATYRRGPEEVSWQGDLRVELPGFGAVPLAGPGAHVSMCADAGCRP